MRGADSTRMGDGNGEARWDGIAVSFVSGPIVWNGTRDLDRT